MFAYYSRLAAGPDDLTDQVLHPDPAKIAAVGRGLRVVAQQIKPPGFCPGDSLYFLDTVVVEHNDIAHPHSGSAAYYNHLAGAKRRHHTFANHPAQQRSRPFWFP